MSEKTKIPSWIKKRAVSGRTSEEVRRYVEDNHIETVCRSAVCPNIYECFNRRYLTFLIMGDRCTRDCRFCGVSSRPSNPPDPEESSRVAEAVRFLKMSYVVLTSPTRDDLPDGGAGHFSATVYAVRKANPGVTIEVLIPDFRGDRGSLSKLFESSPDIISHNVETVPSLYPDIRPSSSYETSMGVLRHIKEKGFAAKSSFMLGLGEKREEVMELMAALRLASCDYLVIGQYLRPSKSAVPVREFVRPEVFAGYEEEGKKMGFTNVFAGTFCRSSYMAENLCHRSTAGQGS